MSTNVRWAAWVVAMGLVLGLGPGRSAQGQPAPEPTWLYECSRPAVPPNHLYCEARDGDYQLRALYGPNPGSMTAPTAIYNNPTVKLNTDSHFTWRVQSGYAYLKVSPATISGEQEPGQAGPQEARRARKLGPIHIKALSYWRSLRSTRSLLSSPGSVIITQLADDGPVRARCFLLDENDPAVHTATCRRIGDGVVHQERALAEGQYIEFTGGSGNTPWAMGEPQNIKDLRPGDPAKVFLEWAWKNAKDQGLDPPPL